MAFDQNLPEPARCQGSLVSTRNLSSTLFFSHPANPQGARAMMTVRRSDDGGASWPRSLLVFAGGAAYSCLSPMPAQFPGRVGLLFEREGDECSGGASCKIAFTALDAKF